MKLDLGALAIPVRQRMAPPQFRSSVIAICTLQFVCCTQRIAPPGLDSSRHDARDPAADQMRSRRDSGPDTGTRTDQTAKDSIFPDQPISLAGVTIPGFGIQVAVGDSAKLSAEATWTDGSTTDVTFAANWSSNDPSVATVGNGPGFGGTVTGIAVGVTQVTASYQGVTSAPRTVLVPFTDHWPQLSIEPTSIVIAVGDTAQFTVLAVFSGKTQIVTSGCSWATSAPALLQLAAPPNLGKITALAPGSATVTAYFQGLKASASVVVK